MKLQQSRPSRYNLDNEPVEGPRNGVGNMKEALIFISVIAQQAFIFGVGMMVGKRARSHSQMRYFVIVDGKRQVGGTWQSRRRAERVRSLYQSTHPQSNVKVWGASHV